MLERILSLIQAMGVNRRTFAQSVQYSESYLSHILAGRKAITRKFTRALRDNHGVNLHWFFTGEGEMIGPSIMPRPSDADYNYWTSDPAPFPLELEPDLLPVFDLPPDSIIANQWPNPLPKVIDRFKVDIYVGTTHVFRLRSYEMYPRLAPEDLMLCTLLPSLDTVMPSRRKVYVIQTGNRILTRYITQINNQQNSSIEVVAEDPVIGPVELIELAQIDYIWAARYLLMQDELVS
jgi:hypothetical protein